MKKHLIIILMTISSLSCQKEKDERVDFDLFLSEPCMIVNYEQDNTLEGRYLRVRSLKEEQGLLKIKLPPDFYLNEENLEDWLVGWGDDTRLYDAGCENLREIKEIDPASNSIFLGELKRGSGWPHKNQRIVFWNRNPSGYRNTQGKPIIDPSGWPLLKGDFLNFAPLVYDPLLSKWVMLLQDIDATEPKIFAAVSEDLVQWEPYHEGTPNLEASDFKNTSWAREAHYGRTPLVTSLIVHKGIWHLFLDGHSTDGQRHIGMAVSEKSSAGPYRVLDEPILSPGLAGKWDDHYCFFGKVTAFNDGFLLFYDGRNQQGEENVGFAFSNDLRKWEKSTYNPVMPPNSGWRSHMGVSEPAWVEVTNDSIFLLIAGAKKLKMPPPYWFQPNRMYLDVSGNVDDAQLGAFLSTDGGKTFIPHANNPMFTNDYANSYENDHLGANFQRIKTDTMDYIFYQARTEDKYNILMRTR